MSIIREIELPTLYPAAPLTELVFVYLCEYVVSALEVWGYENDFHIRILHFTFVRMNSILLYLYVISIYFFFSVRFIAIPFSFILKNYLQESQFSSVLGFKRRLQIVRRSHYASNGSSGSIFHVMCDSNPLTAFADRVWVCSGCLQQKIASHLVEFILLFIRKIERFIS